MDFAAGTGAGGDAEGDRLANVESLWGSAHADRVLGSAGADSLSGGAGADELDGGAGDDWLRGNQDDDSLLGAQGSDRLLGGAGADLLHGGDGDDLILGEEGADILVGGAGTDRLIGGKGADIFTFDVDGEHIDVVDDFSDGEDRIDLSGFGNLSFGDLLISDDGRKSVIDLTVHGGGRIVLRNFNPSDLDASDFLFAR